MAHIRELVETAWTGYLTAEAVTTNIYAGMAAGTKDLPCVICRAVSAEEEPFNSGNFRVTVRVTTKAALADGLAAFNTLCTSVNSSVDASDVLTQLMANASGLTVWGVAAETKIEWESEDDVWIEHREVVLYCAARTFAA